MKKINFIVKTHRKEVVFASSCLVLIILTFGLWYFQVYADGINEESIDYYADNIALSIEKTQQKENDTVENSVQPAPGEQSEEEKIIKVRVDIKGEVTNPGVYELDSNSRVIDVINCAGGLTEQAETKVNNLSKKIKDEMVIIIYSKDEVASFLVTKENEAKSIEESNNIYDVITNDASIANDDIINNTNKESVDNNQSEENNKVLENNKQSSSKISINTASKLELMKLNGIGEAKANAIIDYRNEHGTFQNIEDIKNVSGIGDKIFEKIKDNITI